MTPACVRIGELAPELALGLVEGAERAEALGHLATCPACYALVEDLARVADDLLLLGPEAEPPVGFEARVLDRLERADRPRRRARPWWRRPLVPAVALGAVAASLVAGVVVGRMTEREPMLERQYVAALRTLGGSSLRAGRLHDAEGADGGEVFLYRGRPSWLFVDLRDPDAPAGPYRVDLVGPDGRTLGSNDMAVDNGAGTLGWTLRVDTGGVVGVVVHDARGDKTYRAQLPRSS